MFSIYKPNSNSASYRRFLEGDECHTPFQERGNEASIRVPRMFKSHTWQQYDKQMQCYKITSNISYITTRGSEKDYIKAAEITKHRAAPQA
jgi:hypothetical protein